MSMLRSLMKSETGATAIEYGMIAALIAVASLVAFSAVGSHLADAFDSVANKFPS